MCLKACWAIACSYTQTALQTVDAGSNYIKDTQQQGESAWQKVKDRVTETVDKVTSCSHFWPCIISRLNSSWPH